MGCYAENDEMFTIALRWERNNILGINEWLNMHIGRMFMFISFYIRIGEI